MPRFPEIDDPSQELRHHALEGVAVMRNLQLEMDEFIAFDSGMDF